uniref:Uncharacterized protein n=1 Tax=Leersia perrieri TaxID=77586 RepID=A0A0D9WQU6_9ORYZ
MDYPVPPKMTRHARQYQDGEGRSTPDRFVGAIISDLEASTTQDDQDNYSASESDNSQAAYAMDRDDASTSASMTPAQRLATMQQTLDEAPTDAAAGAEIVSWTDRLREAARNLDSTLAEAEQPGQPSLSEAARRATAPDGDAAVGAVAANGTPNINAAGQPTATAGAPNQDANAHNKIATAPTDGAEITKDAVTTLLFPDDIQRLATMQQTLDEAPTDAAAGAEIVSWTDRLREAARNLDSTLAEAEQPGQPSLSEAARRATAPDGDAAVGAVAANGTPNINAAGQPTATAGAPNQDANAHNKVNDKEPTDNEHRHPRGRINRERTPPADRDRADRRRRDHKRRRHHTSLPRRHTGE